MNQVANDKFYQETWRRQRPGRRIIGSIIVVLGVLSVIGVLLVSTALAQGDNPRLAVMVEALNVRQGPGVTYPALVGLRRDDTVEITGHHAASGWWQVKLADGRKGWVSGGSIYVQVSGDTTGVPEIAAPAAGEAAAAAVTRPAGGTLVFQTSSGGPIYAVNADTPGGANLRQLTTGLDPVLSPDGRRVAFTRWDSPGFGALGSVWVINVDGSGEQVVLSGVAGRPKSPAWSPDGQRLVFSMQLAGGHNEDLRVCGKSSIPPEAFDIEYVVNDKGEGSFCYTLPPKSFWGLRVVTIATGAFQDLPGDMHAFSPTWHPVNSDRLVYDGERGLVNLTITQGQGTAMGGDVLDHSPVFSPNGQRLAVTYWQNDHWEIHVMNAEGSGRARLTETSLIDIVEQRLQGVEPRIANNAAAAWSPDGTQLAFLSDRSGRWEIWVMAADGAGQRPLFPAGTLDSLNIQYYGMDERALSWK